MRPGLAGFLAGVYVPLCLLIDEMSDWQDAAAGVQTATFTIT